MPRRQRLIRERAKRLERQIQQADYISRDVRGTPLKNQFTGHVRDLARAYTEVAMSELNRLMTHSKIDSIRLLAASTILERGWGKPAQAVSGPDGEGEATMRVVHEVKRTLVRAGPQPADNENGKLRSEPSSSQRKLR